MIYEVYYLNKVVSKKFKRVKAKNLEEAINKVIDNDDFDIGKVRSFNQEILDVKEVKND